MADPMRIRATMAGDKVEVRVLMAHEMETGQRKDAKGELIPAWFIQNVSAVHNGRTVMSAEWGPAVSKNPFLHFRFKGAKAGEKLSITWTDNKGDKRTDEATIN
jgi:sulfur-oxidizing protein SoxZ